MKALSYLLALSFLFALCRTDLPAQTANVSGAAREAFDSGVIAAGLPNYPLAIRFFEEARTLAPSDPVIFYNLGLAESQISGRELRAISWFSAYLATNPTAPNAAAVKELINLLDVRSQSNLSRLISSLQDMANQFAEDNKNANLSRVAELWAKTGDIAAAQRVANLIQNVDSKSRAQAYITKFQAEAGDIDAAQKTVELIQNEDWKSSAQACVVEAQAKRGDIAAALRTTALIKNADRKRGAWRHLGNGQAESGDVTEALKTAALLPSGNEQGAVQAATAKAQVRRGDIAGGQRTADLIQDGDWQSNAQAVIAKTRVKLGDIAAAQRTVAVMRNADWKSDAQLVIAEAQAKGGDIVEARKTAASTSNPYYKSVALVAIAAAQAKHGEITAAENTFVEAQQTADLINSASSKRSARRQIAEARAKLNNSDPAKPTYHVKLDNQSTIEPITVSSWLEIIDDRDETSSPLKSEPFLSLPAYLQSLPRSDNPQTVFTNLQETIDTIATAQNAIHKMVQQQAAQTYVQDEPQEGPTITGVSTPESNSPSITRTTEHTYQGRQIILAPELLFDLTGKIASATVNQSQYGDSLSLVLREGEVQSLEKFSERNMNKEVGLLYKGKLVTVAVLRTPITSGRVEITTRGTLQELMKLAEELSAK
jgi:tetratricopeptide (TPR) repeat protein